MSCRSVPPCGVNHAVLRRHPRKWMIDADAAFGKRNMPAQIHLFPCLKDNFGVLLHDTGSGATASIDAPEAAPVEAALKKTGWRPTRILVAHPHADPPRGTPQIK